MAAAIARPALGNPTMPCSPAFVEHLQWLPMPSETQVVVIEDKDTASGWLSDLWAYRARAWTFLRRDGAWAEAPLSIPEAGRFIAALFRTPDLHHLVPTYPAARWEAGLPNIYLTMKAKCWESSRYVCTRASH